MRKIQKQQSIEFLNTLQEAHYRIIQSIETKDYESAMDWLADCQQGAIALGNMIENVSIDAESISCLEEYCEILYEFSCKIQSPDFSEVMMHEFINRLENILVQVRKDIMQMIPLTYEIVFLPYKAAMWDSLESIWQEALRDENCNVYVIPIPYYDKNPDGTMRKMHYEKDLYSENIEITDYRSYDFAGRHPDAIFIHSPYDDCNYITSVLPAFYSHQLKNYTDQLVYVPYYVSGGAGSEMHNMLPAYENVDLIIAQSKNQISYFAPEVQNKVFAMGSPKFDKVIQMAKTGIGIPEEWKGRLCDTVIFLNTGINGLLNNNENSLLKVLYVLKIALQAQVTVLWRPHPLLESTIRSMRPELLELYLKTMDTFKKYSYGILDYSANVDRAITLADAYIGESTSSISHLFGVTGKPVFFIRQNILREEKDTENIKISACVEDPENSNVIWGVAAGRNGLVKISQSGNVEMIYIIPGEKETSNLYIDLLARNGLLYLIPRNAKEIAVFDTVNEQFIKVPIVCPNQKEKFNKGYFYHGDLYLVPRFYDALTVMSCKDFSVQYYEKPVKRMKKITGGKKIFGMATASVLIKNSLYFASSHKPVILEYELVTRQITEHVISECEEGFCCMETVDEQIIAGCRNQNKIIIWNPVDGEQDVITGFPDSWNKDLDYSFDKIVAIKDMVYVFPRKNNMILKFSLKDHALTKIGEEFPFSITERKSAFYNHPNHFIMIKKVSDNVILLQDANRHGLTFFSTKEKFRWIEVKVTDMNELDAMSQSFSKQGNNLPWGVLESRYHSIRLFMEYVRSKMHDYKKQKEAFGKIAENLDGTAGEKIYDFVREKVVHNN